MPSKWRRTPEDNRAAQRQFRKDKIAAGYVHLQAWVKHEHRNKVKQFIKDLERGE